ncbi:MAG: hypothetical protein ACRD28_13000 [Acidobacteriaceae bacterium]
MNRFRFGSCASLFSLILLTIVSCGTGSGSRTLLSISVSPAVATAPKGPIQFIATGTFSSPPYTVAPLPALWTGSWTALPALCVGDACVGIDPNTGLALCGGVPPKVTITASAPSNPNLPLNSQNVPLVSGTATLNCN